MGNVVPMYCLTFDISSYAVMVAEVIISVTMSFQMDAAIPPVIEATDPRLRYFVSAFGLFMMVRIWSASTS